MPAPDFEGMEPGAIGSGSPAIRPTSSASTAATSRTGMGQGSSPRDTVSVNPASAGKSGGGAAMHSAASPSRDTASKNFGPLARYSFHKVGMLARSGFRKLPTAANPGAEKSADALTQAYTWTEVHAFLNVFGRHTKSGPASRLPRQISSTWCGRAPPGAIRTMEKDKLVLTGTKWEYIDWLAFSNRKGMSRGLGSGYVPILRTRWLSALWAQLRLENFRMERPKTFFDERSLQVQGRPLRTAIWQCY